LSSRPPAAGYRATGKAGLTLASKNTAAGTKEVAIVTMIMMNTTTMTMMIIGDMLVLSGHIISTFNAIAGRPNALRSARGSSRIIKETVATADALNPKKKPSHI